MTYRIAPSARRRVTAVAAGMLLAAGSLAGLAGCKADAQTPYPEQTSESPTPTPTPTDLPSPVPTTVDDSGTLGG